MHEILAGDPDEEVRVVKQGWDPREQESTEDS